MDALDRMIVNSLQGGIGICERPYLLAAAALGIGEDELIRRVARMLQDGTLTRFGPMYNADRLGGAFTLAAMGVPADDFERVAGLVNAHPEVAHNYQRDHALNMWFVIATEQPEEIAAVIDAIQAESGYAVVNLPKLDEYYVGLRLEAQ
jgi:DNA-binding Lrp family transcriptional regulator